MSIDHHISGPQYWRSLEQLAESPEVLAQIEAEFPRLLTRTKSAACRAASS